MDVWPTDERPRRAKYYFDGGRVDVTTHLVYELDADGKQLQVGKFTDYTRDRVRTMYANTNELRGKWSDPEQRKLIVEQLEERGISLTELAKAAGKPDADPLDLLCHIAFNAPLQTRRERAERLRNHAGITGPGRHLDRYLWITGRDMKWLRERHKPKNKQQTNVELRRHFEHPTPVLAAELDVLLSSMLHKPFKGDLPCRLVSKLS